MSKLQERTHHSTWKNPSWVTYDWIVLDFVIFANHMQRRSLLVLGISAEVNSKKRYTMESCASYNDDQRKTVYIVPSAFCHLAPSPVLKPSLKP